MGGVQREVRCCLQAYGQRASLHDCDLCKGYARSDIGNTCQNGVSLQNLDRDCRRRRMCDEEGEAARPFGVELEGGMASLVEKDIAR